MRKILSFFMILILAYLVLIHFTGFGKDVSALATGTSNVTKALQGR